MKKAQIKFIYKCFFKKKLYDFLIKKRYGEKNINSLLKNHNIKVNGEVIENKFIILKPGAKVEVSLNSEISDLPFLAEKIDVVYEDKYILVVNKPKNLDIEPTKSNYYDNLATRVNNYYKENGIESKIHFVNRLDKLTEGLVILAKNQYIHNLFSNVKIIKKYQAIVSGKTLKKGTVKIKIVKETNSIKRIVSKEGKKCITKYKLVEYDGKNSLVNIRLLTGRTHQIRVSFAHIGHPLIGDPLYSNFKNIKDFYLKAYYLEFKHPILKKKITLNAL